MKAIQASLVATLLLVASPASSQTLDLSTVKCGEFLTSGKENVSVILAWMNAYYMDEDAKPILDFAKMGQDAERLAKGCAEKPDLGLMTVADGLFSK